MYNMTFNTEEEAFRHYHYLLTRSVEFTVRQPFQLDNGQWYLSYNVWSLD